MGLACDNFATNVAVGNSLFGFEMIHLSNAGFECLHKVFYVKFQYFFSLSLALSRFYQNIALNNNSIRKIYHKNAAASRCLWFDEYTEMKFQRIDIITKFRRSVFIHFTYHAMSIIFCVFYFYILRLCVSCLIMCVQLTTGLMIRLK